MLSLDEDDYAVLGWGRVEIESDPRWYRAAQVRLAQVRAAGRKYSASPKGKAARDAYAASPHGREAHRKASLKWARANADKARENARKFRERNPNYQREYRERKKREREQASAASAGLDARPGSGRASA